MTEAGQPDYRICVYDGCEHRPVALVRNPSTKQDEAHCSPHLVEALRVMPEELGKALSPIPVKPFVLAPGTVITPDVIESQLVSLVERLEGGTAFAEAQLRRLSDVKLDWEMSYAAAYGVSEARNDKGRHHEALLATRDHYAAMRAVELVVQTTKIRLSAIQTEITAWQSLSRSVGQAMTSQPY